MKLRWAGSLFVIAGLSLWCLQRRSPTSVVEGSALLHAEGVVSSQAHFEGVKSDSPSSLAAPVLNQPVAVSEMSQSLLAYVEIQRKPFPTPEEKLLQENRLQQQELYVHARKLLLDVQGLQDPRYEEEQGAAIDFLRSAVEQDRSGQAIHVISEVILDRQVEDEQLSMANRERLAQSKAELMYYAAAHLPDQFSQWAAQMPGPVSQKILENVRIQQAQNIEISNQEVASHHARWGSPAQ